MSAGQKAEVSKLPHGAYLESEEWSELRADGVEGVRTSFEILVIRYLTNVLCTTSPKQNAVSTVKPNIANEIQYGTFNLVTE